MPNGSESVLADENTAVLRIYLLGTPVVRWGSLPLDIPRTQTRALLYRLAAGLEPLSRDQLCALFWPDLPESLARRNLTRLLTHLRRALPLPSLLLVDKDWISLDPRHVWSDVVAFSKLCVSSQQGLRFLHAGYDNEAMREAVGLYHAPFLAGFSLTDCPDFEVWVVQERRAQERLYLQVLDALIDSSASSGAYAAAIAYAQRYLASDDLAEAMHRRLIELYAASGNRSAALRQYEQCAAILLQELGVSPLPETVAAYQAVLEGASPGPRLVVRTLWATLPSLDAPLVGRDDALCRIEAIYTRAQAGRGSVVLVSGEPGIGKSRLVQDVLTAVTDRAMVLISSCHESEHAVPFRPLLEALRPHVAVMGREAPDVAPHYPAPLAQVMPELRTIFPESPSFVRLPADQDQQYLCDALVSLLQALMSGFPPLVLCMDDLHWADAGTLLCLEHLSRVIADLPLLVLGTYRSGENAGLAALRSQAARLNVLHEIVMEPLCQADTLRLVRHVAGAISGARRLGHRLQRAAGGNPFYVLEMLRAMREAGAFLQGETLWRSDTQKRRADICDLPLPDSVRQNVHDRVNRLSPPTRQVLEAAAVIGRQFDLDLVRRTSDLPENDVVDALEMLAARQVISELDGAYCFNHGVVHTVVYRDLSQGRQQMLQRRVAEALARREAAYAAAQAAAARRAAAQVGEESQAEGRAANGR
jgi:DNA-binding SARP family transcriptional activator